MKAITPEDLAGFLEALARAVKAGDSLEGFVNYLLPDPDDPAQAKAAERGQLMAEIRVRTGNLQGQGGYEMFGVEVQEGASERDS